ncbi:MAG: T9SS type A sorting domain-containing protein [Spirosomataceae bacterium]
MNTVSEISTLPNAKKTLPLSTPLAMNQKEKLKKGPKPHRLSTRRKGFGEADEDDEDDDEEDEDHESHEKEEKERAEFSEERARFDFDLLKDPALGTIPRSAPLLAAEAAQAKAAELPIALPPPVTVVPRGPNNLGGRTRAIGIDVRNANIMLAGSVSSGVFRSTNGGTSWTRVAPIGQIHNVTAITQDPRAGNQDTWYYGGGESIGNSTSLGATYRGFGIWKSTDNGLTWAPLASTQTSTVLEAFDNPFDYVHRIVVDPSNGYIYAASSDVISRSTDGGATWATVLGTFNNSAYTDIIVTPTGRLYAAFDGRDAQAAGVWTSSTGDSGSWTRIGGPGGTPSHPNWNVLNGYGRTVLAYAPSNPDIVFALYWRGTTHTAGSPNVEAEFYKWDNSVSTWTDLTANLPDEPGYRAGNDPFAVQTGYDLVVAVKPDDVNTVFVGGTNVYRSTSGFTNTTATTRIGGYNSPASYALYPNHHPDIHALVFANGNNTTLYCGDDGGIQKADITQPSVTWTSLNNNYTTYQYYHADIEPTNGSTVVMGGAQDNGTTANPGGTDFSSVLGGDGCQTGIISYTDASTFNVIAASQNGNLVRLTGPNNGFTIYPATSGLGIFVTYFQLDQDNTNLLYYADNAAMFRTRNASNLTGTTEGDPATGWQKMTALGITGDIRSMASSRNNAYGGAAYTASDANRKLYFGSSSGRVYRLNDPAFVAATTAAVNITPPTASLSAIVSSIAVNPWDDNEIMVTYSNYGVVSVFHTLNANSATPTWTEVEGPANTPVQLGSARSCIITRIGTTTTYLVGTSTGLYATQALSGATTNWEPIGVNEINYAVCASMRLRVTDNRIALGTHGNGMFELQLPPAVAPGVTVTTSPTGLSFSVDATPYTSAQTFNWANGSTHTIATTTPQNPSVGTRYLFNNWSDAGAISHSVTATTAAVTYTANFDTEYMLTTNANAACGSITPATGYQPAGNVVVTATPAMGYTFTGFSGALTGTTNPQTLNLTAPATVTANFSIPTSVTLNVLPNTPICQGQQLTFTAVPTNGGTTPQYRWFKNGVLIPGETNVTLVTNTLANGDKIKVELTSNIPCPSQAVVESSEITVTIKPTPSSALIASQTDVCPNTEVTLNAQCSVPTATVSWNPGAPTVIPDAANIPYIYKATCSLDGCTGNESSVEVRTHRILVDIKNVGAGAQPKAIIGALKDNLAPTNTFTVPASPRVWTILANGCSTSESAVFKLSGPVNFNSIDNNPPYAIFANVGSDYFAIDHPNYGTGGSFPNGTYTLTAELRSADGAGGPFPKNRVATGALLATRTLQFTLNSVSVRQATSEISSSVYPTSALESFSVEVSPNPVSNMMHLKVLNAKGESLKVSLTDALGRTLLQQNVVPQTNQYQEEFSVRDIPNGVYFLWVISDHKNTALKVVKAE